jgi:hypothetical protein
MFLKKKKTPTYKFPLRDAGRPRIVEKSHLNNLVKSFGFNSILLSFHLMRQEISLGKIKI